MLAEPAPAVCTPLLHLPTVYAHLGRDVQNPTGPPLIPPCQGGRLYSHICKGGSRGNLSLLLDHYHSKTCVYMVAPSPPHPSTPLFPVPYSPSCASDRSGFSNGKAITSRMLALSVNSMTRRSMPMPSPHEIGRAHV